MQEIAEPFGFKPVVEVQIIFSAIFVFLGALVFFISSLISGHNVFRDMSSQLALLVCTIVGFVLFALSPISFLTLAPELFNIRGDNGSAWLIIHQTIREHLFWPFMLFAIGMGSVFGAFQAIYARTLFLGWLRKHIRVGFPILSYEKSWDAFLLSIKKGGQVHLMRKNGGEPCSGKLQFISIRDEPKEITIECEGKYRLVDANDIAYIEAPSKSFNRHLDVTPHQAEAFYLAVGVLGLLLIAWSADLTAMYFHSVASFQALANLYRWLCLALSVAALVFAVVSFQASRQDYRHLCSYLALYPAVPAMLLLEAYGGLLLILHELAQLWPAVRHGVLDGWIPWKTVGGIIVVFIFYKWIKGRRIDDLIVRVAGDANHVAQRENLKEACRFIYQEVDLNQSTPAHAKELLEALSTQDDAEALKRCVLLKRLFHEMACLIKDETFLWVRADRYLQGEELNIILRLLRKLEKERGKNTAIANDMSFQE